MELELPFGSLLFCLGLLVFTFSFEHYPLWLFVFFIGGYFYVRGIYDLLKQKG